MGAASEMVRLKWSERPYEWINFDVKWRSWAGDGVPSVDLITKDGKKLKSTNGLIPITPDVFPVFAIRLDATGFERAWELLMPLVINWADVAVSSVAIRILEMRSGQVDVDLERSDYVAVGERVDMIRSTVVVSEVLPRLMTAAQGSPDEFFFRGDFVQSLGECGVLDAFEPTVIGRVVGRDV